MVKGIRVPKGQAQETKRFLIEQRALDTNHTVDRNSTHIIFPVKDNYKGQFETFQYTFNERPIKKQAITFKKALEKVLTEEEINCAKTAYELVGETATIEVPETLSHKSKEIGQALLDSNKYIQTVLQKAGGHKGTYRKQHMVVLAGKPTTVATYKENNCWITYDLDDMYFSARLATERKRIYKQVKKGENILVMFSGAAPYPCVIAKNTKAQKIIGVEINPAGHKFGELNIRQNKLTNVELHCGDVREVVPTLGKKFDRIIMPLPKTAEEFLDIALAVAKPGCTVHLYGFYHEDNFNQAYEKISKYCKHQEHTILSTTKVGQQSPRTYRICVDFIIK